MKLNLLKILGVEEGEIFKLNGYEYKIVSGDLYSKKNPSDFVWIRVNYPIYLLHEAEFERLPFVPKAGERYWTAQKVYTHDQVNVTEYKMELVGIDIKNLELGLCYRTKEEAEREGIPKLKALIEKWGGKNE